MKIKIKRDLVVDDTLEYTYCGGYAFTTEMKEICEEHNYELTVADTWTDIDDGHQEFEVEEDNGRNAWTQDMIEEVSLDEV